jgi:hypothetical protein
MVSDSKQTSVDSIANYCNWLEWSVFLREVVTGTAANTLSQTKASVSGNEGTCGKSSEGKEGNFDVLLTHLFVCLFVCLFIYLLCI